MECLVDKHSSGPGSVEYALGTPLQSAPRFTHGEAEARVPGSLGAQSGPVAALTLLTSHGCIPWVSPSKAAQSDVSP